MTAETLEIRKKIDKRIAILSPKQLNGLLTSLESFSASISDEVAAMFITGNGLDVSDEELEQMKYEYLTEKYGK